MTEIVSAAEKLKPSPDSASGNSFKVSDSERPKWEESASDLGSKQKPNIYAVSDSEKPKWEGDEIEKVEPQELVREYFSDLKANSEYPETVKDNINSFDLKKISPEENSEMRQQFNQEKAELIKEWENNTGKLWPTYSENVYSENGILIRKAGDRFDAHHITPLELGGKNSADNITPIHAEKHYDSQGVHSPDSPYRSLVNAVKGEQKNDSF
jgi:hypothetical protein